MRPVLPGVRQINRGISNLLRAHRKIWAPKSAFIHNFYHPETLLGQDNAKPAESSVFSRLGFGRRSRTPLARDNTVLSGEDEPDLEDTLRTEQEEEELGQQKIEYPPLGSESYGKWQSLSMDHGRLLFESDVHAPNTGVVRLVDRPENENDIALWSLILQFCHRRMGRDGVVMIWSAVLSRRKLRTVDGPLAQAFWQRILNAAVYNEAFLQDVWLYAEWMLLHGAVWPQLYLTTMSFLLSHRPAHDVARWHIRLSAAFGLAEDEFLELLRKFITNPEDEIQENLQMLYSASVHRNFYDTLIPFLYFNGHSNLAQNWRKLFVIHNDRPHSPAARPFLRYLAGYYPALIVNLTEEELSIAGLETKTSKPAIKGRSLRYLMTKFQDAHGIKEKSYNDNFGARWFASSWVHLDFAINVVHTMGVDRIGPLSVQSIALRESTAEGVLHRLDQLRQLKINVPSSNYVRIIRHLATIGDNETLQDLLHSDIHPDLFDDYSGQRKLLAQCFMAGDWKLYRLVFAARLAVCQDMISLACNQVMQAVIHRSDGPMAFNVLKDMVSTDVRMLPATSHLVSSFILHHTFTHHSAGTGPNADLDMHISMCRYLATTRFPPAVEVWQVLLSRLGRDKRLDDLDRLSLEVMRMYVDYTSSGKTMNVFHMSDVPEVLRQESPFPKFQKLPRDLPLSHVQHPIRQIFDSRLQSSIVRWGFLYTRYQHQPTFFTHKRFQPRSKADPEMLQSQLPDFYFARGVRLLAMLRDQGLIVHENSVRKAVLLRLIDLYSAGLPADQQYANPSSAIVKKLRDVPLSAAKQLIEAGRQSARLKMIRKENELDLTEAKELCEAAWGSAFLPSVSELHRGIKDNRLVK